MDRENNSFKLLLPSQAQEDLEVPKYTSWSIIQQNITTYNACDSHGREAGSKESYF